MAHINCPDYELAAMTPKDVRQVMDRLPHHSAAAFLTAWHEACQKMRHHDALPAPDELVTEMNEYVSALEGDSDE